MNKFGILLFVAFAATLTGCGKSQFKEFAPPDGRFTIQMPGKPRKEEMGFGALRLTMFGDVVNEEEYAVGYVDVQSGLPDMILINFMNGVVGNFRDGSGDFNVASVTNGTGTYNFEFVSPKYGGHVTGRVLLARGRLYLVYSAGKDALRSNADVQKFLDSFQLTDGPMPGKTEKEPTASSEPSTGSNRPSSSGKTKPSSDSPATSILSPLPTDSASTVLSPLPSAPGAPGGTRPERPQMVGSTMDPEFKESAPAGGFLVGFDVGFGYQMNSNHDSVVAVRPIFRVGDKDQIGQVRGGDTKRAMRVVAKPGYAVGAIHAKTPSMFNASCINGLYITFMKVVGNKLDSNDAYNSIWLGGAGGDGPTTVGGDGRLVVGVVGRQQPAKKDLSAIGLMFGSEPSEPLASSEKKPLPEAPRIPKNPRFVGGTSEPDFIDVSPAGGLLVGFDIAIGHPFQNIATVRPIYQVKGKDKDAFGLIHGTDAKGPRERAKSGYAVGAINVKSGLWVDGFSITYMKVADDKLNPNDTYDSQWYGKQGNINEVTTISGEGALVIGIAGRQGRKDLNALGLMFKE